MPTITQWREAIVTILNTATESEEVDLEAHGARRAKNIMIRGAPTLAVTVTVHLAEKVGGTYAAFSSGGSDVTIPAAKWISLGIISAGALKLVAGSAVGENEVFYMQGVAVD